MKKVIFMLMKKICNYCKIILNLAIPIMYTWVIVWLKLRVRYEFICNVTQKVDCQ